MLFRPDAESLSEMSLVGGARGHHELTVNNSPNSELCDSRETGTLLEICLMEEGGSGICGAAMADRERFCM